MGFRSDVREFFGALLGLVRPSGPWCFPVREGGVFVGTAAPLQQQTTKVAQIITSFSMDFRSNVREFFGALLGLVRPAGPWCFRVRRVVSLWVSSTSSAAEDKSSSNHHFLWVSEATLETLSWVSSTFLAAEDKSRYNYHRHFVWVSEATLESFSVRFSD